MGLRCTRDKVHKDRAGVSILSPSVCYPFELTGSLEALMVPVGTEFFLGPCPLWMLGSEGGKRGSRGRREKGTRGREEGKERGREGRGRKGREVGRGRRGRRPFFSEVSFKALQPELLESVRLLELLFLEQPNTPEGWETRAESVTRGVLRLCMREERLDL